MVCGARLPKAGGREGPRLEGIEQQLGRAAEVGGHDGGRLGAGEGRDAILQQRELLGHLAREQIGPGAEELAELDECGAQGEEGLAQPGGERAAAGGLLVRGESAGVRPLLFEKPQSRAECECECPVEKS